MPYLPPCSWPDALAPVAGAFFGVALPAVPDTDPVYRVIVFLCRAPRFDMVATGSTAVLRRPTLGVGGAPAIAYTGRYLVAVSLAVRARRPET